MIIRLIGMLTGLIGIPLGSFLAQKFRLQLHFQQQADPLLCGSALSLSVPLILATLFLADVNVAACFILISLGTLLVNFNWAVSTDILLVIPSQSTISDEAGHFFSPFPLVHRPTDEENDGDGRSSPPHAVLG